MATGKTRAGRAAPSPQFFGFVAQVAGLAWTVAPDVAAMLDPDGKVAPTPWSGTRERGLKLCVSMLTYARIELADDAEGERIDRALAAVKAVLAGSSGQVETSDQTESSGQVDIET